MYKGKKTKLLTNEIEPIATLYENVLHDQHQQQRVNLQ